jgi:hypothetical protein
MHIFIPWHVFSERNYFLAILHCSFLNRPQKKAVYKILNDAVGPRSEAVARFPQRVRSVKAPHHAEAESVGGEGEARRGADGR